MGKRLRPLFAILLGLVLLAGCYNPSAAPSLPATGETSLAEPVSNGAELALLATPSRLEDSFGQGVRTALTRFAGENGLGFASYKTEEEDASAAASTLELAVKGGARLVVAMDATVSGAVAEQVSRYPEVDFMLLDAAGVAQGGNVMSLQFSAAQAGWLAGYLAMREQRGTLGLAGFDQPASQQYALGFMLGADAAAAEIGLEPMETGILRLVLTEETEEGAWPELAGSLFTQGAGIVFCTAEPFQAEVLRAALAAERWIIGLGLQPDSATFGVLASVWYDPKPLLAGCLANWMEGEFTGGSVAVGGVADGSVQMDYAPESFEQVGAGMLNRLPGLFENGEVAGQLQELVRPGEDGTWPLPEALGLTHVWVRPPAAAMPPANNNAESVPPAPLDEPEDGFGG